MNRVPRRTCLEKALELLGHRAHFRRELETKLLRRGYPSAEVGQTLERLTELGLLDDPRTAANYLETRSARAPAGRRLLRAELGRRGLSAPQSQTLTAEIDELALAQDAAGRFLRRRARPGETGRQKSQALARHLGSRGFSAAVIGKVLAVQPNEEDENWEITDDTEPDDA